MPSTVDNLTPLLATIRQTVDNLLHGAIQWGTYPVPASEVIAYILEIVFLQYSEDSV